MSVTKTKKILFDEDGDEYNSDENQTKNVNLFDDDDDEDKNGEENGADNDNDDNDDGVELFEKKLKLDENKANKLIYMKTKFSNDSRFQINEKFLESDEEKSGDDEKEDDNDVDADLKKENEASLKILESLTGKSAKRKNEQPQMQVKPTSGMMRYDPTKEESKKFEVKYEEEKKLKEKNRLKNELKRANDEDGLKKSEPIVDSNKYYDIQPDIKNAFSSSEAFTFKFSSAAVAKSDDNGLKTSSKQKTDDEKKFKAYAYLNDHTYKSSSESEFDDEDEAEEDDFYEKENNYKNNRVVEDKGVAALKEPVTRLFADKKIDFSEASFIPDLEDKQIQEALKFFTCTKTDTELRAEWIKTRESLVQDYKKKDKKAKRVQRHKEDEKQHAWKKTSFEQKNQKKFKKPKK